MGHGIIKGILMRNIIILLFLMISVQALGGTCTSDTFTSNAANSVLTSTKYNADHTTIYNRLNGSLDGGCVSNGTLEIGGLATDVAEGFAVPLNAIKEGCEVTRSDANTMSINRCMIAVNGEWVRTTAATTVTWGANGGSSEVASTTYYVYVNTGSTGATLTPSIRSGAPNADGYDGSSNRILARIYNNSSSDLLQYKIEQWDGKAFTENYGSALFRGVANAPVIYQAYIDCDAGSTISSQAGLTPNGSIWLTSVANISSGTCVLTLNADAFDAVYSCYIMADSNSTTLIPDMDTITTTSVEIGCHDQAAANCTNYDFRITCFGTAD